MKCVIRTLKESVSDANLPVFPAIVLKNYLTTSQNGQQIYFPDIYITYNKTKVDIVYERTGSSLMTIFSIGGSEAYLSNNSTYCVPFNKSRVDYFTVTDNTEIHAGLDTSDASAYVNAQTGTAATPVSSSFYGLGFRLFAKAATDTDSVAGVIKIKRIYIKTWNDVTSQYDEFTLVPALYGTKAVLYDADRNVVYGEANGGDLVCG